MIYLIKRIYLLCFVLCLICGCERRELDYSYKDLAELNVLFDWSKAGINPKAATVLFYRKGYDTPIVHLTNFDLSEVHLPKGVYNIIGFNETTDGFDNVAFREINDYNTLEAYAKPLIVRSKGVADDFVENPDTLGAYTILNFSVTEEMIEKTKLRAAGNEMIEEKDTVKLYPERVIATAEVIVHVKGLNNIYTAKGAIYGFSNSVKLLAKEYTNNTSSHIVNFTTATYYGDSEKDGILQGKLTLFELPSGKNVIFRFSSLLVDVDHTPYIKDVDITSMITKVRHTYNNHYIIEVGTRENPVITPPDVDHGPESGFNPDVDDWGDPEDIFIDSFN
ncbi:MAG: DUF5119 domain-containing protein [Marinifilaceae bacterium]